MANPKEKTVNYDTNFSLVRGVLPYNNLNFQDGNVWRNIARKQPIVMNIISTLTMYIHSLPYEIRPKDPTKRKELQSSIEYHQEVFENAQNGAGFLVYLELLLEDFNMIPFGAATETVRYPDGKLYKILAVDGATFFPVLEGDYVAAQIPPYTGDKKFPILFKSDELKRMYRFPRPELQKRGWGMSPLERVYLAVEMLSRGDAYYANLLLDTPEAGILDLGDMSEDSAKKWVESFKLMFTGLDPFKIPVLYEHNTPAKYIPFGRPPSEIVFNETSLRYAQIIAGAWGLTLGDIGLSSFSGNSLAGAIREERKSKSTGYGTVKKFLQNHLTSLLPPELEFVFIDSDDEFLLSLGRARSANAVAGKNLIEAGIVSPKQFRRQLIADNLLSEIPEGEEIDISDFELYQDVRENGGSRKNISGGKMREDIDGREHVPPSRGGMGEIKSALDDRINIKNKMYALFDTILKRANDARVRKLIKICIRNNYDILKGAIALNDDFEGWSKSVFDYHIGGEHNISDAVVLRTLQEKQDALDSYFEKETWFYIDDDEELALIFASLFSIGLLEAAKDIQEQLYENDIVPEPEIQYSPNIDVIRANSSFKRHISNFIDTINSGSIFYIKRIGNATIFDAGLIPVFAEFLRESQSYLDLINNQQIMNYFVDRFRNLLRDFFQERASLIGEVEIDNLYNYGYLEQLRKVGVTRKYIEVTEPDVCELCLENAGLGLVPLDYKYSTKYGDFSEAPTFHPLCKCRLKTVVGDDLNESPVFF